MSWSAEAAQVVADLLLYIPTSLRNEVQHQVAEHAQELAGDQGRAVDRDTAILAVLHSTPLRLRPRIYEAMSCLGIDDRVFRPLDF